METFNYKCPNCGANVEYDAATGLLFCNACGQFYEASKVKTNVEMPEDVTKNATIETGSKNANLNPNAAWHTFEALEEVTDVPSNAAEDNGYAPEYMEVNIFHCSSCGAELMTNDVEVSKFCVYCGQSTVIFDRVSNEQRPDKILPFKITREDAIAKIRSRFAKTKCLPDGFNEATIDSVCGVYMPYWVYDSHLEMGLQITYKRKEHGVTETFGSKDMLVSLDASKKFSDEASIELNPFPLEEAVDFNPIYLSGYFGDRFDVSFENRKNDAYKVIYSALEEDLHRKLGSNYTQMKEVYGDSLDKIMNLGIETTVGGIKHQLNSIQYAFLPVYFITFHSKGRLIIILVNGATGKIVGSVPIDETKLKKTQTKNMIISGVIFGIIGAILFSFLPAWWVLGVFIILTGSMFFAGKTAKKKFEKMQREMNSSSMFELLRNRD